MKTCVILLSTFLFGSCAATSYSPEDQKCLTSTLILPEGYCYQSFWQYNPFYKQCVSTCNPWAPFRTKQECDGSCRSKEVCKMVSPISQCTFGSYPVYYYNPKTKKCHEKLDCSYYGNNFPTMRECKETCMKYQPTGPNVNPCTVLPSEGYYCRKKYGSFRFLYDSNTKTCQLFWYRGCGGTENNFPTYYACLDRCTKQYLAENAGKF
ncbi:carboxypeptidase inhibitor SmCI [Dermacentor andersoni]|uniref:Dathoxin-4 n=1 Tax=Dermacentor andersoni TaxID=34620 RepID=B2C6G2_DERAN|nr:carboxypeptidase inhibitor SmCI [Dermacentor andersoni]XP_054918225.1 carboxypeptidase inhibitor SmCI [Dermacentor andersoni]ABZ89564.1 dathoxin-4 [Dermacentor andersoni]